MNTSTEQQLIALNRRFYKVHAASFSATRQAAWPGWRRVFEVVRNQRASDAAREPAGLRVLDLACGNMRLVAALTEAFPSTRIAYYGVDTCDELVATAQLGNATPAGTTPSSPSAEAHLEVSYQRLDVLSELLAQGADAAAIDTVRARLSAPPCDLVGCFGFTHHVPGADLRHALMRLLVSCAEPGGIIALSCWQFMDDERLASKAQTTTDHVRRTHNPRDLEAGDYFLGWQNDHEHLRFCHHVDEAELDNLARTAEMAGAREICRFSADGRSGSLNRYLILQRR